MTVAVIRRTVMFLVVPLVVLFVVPRLLVVAGSWLTAHKKEPASPAVYSSVTVGPEAATEPGQSLTVVRVFGQPGGLKSTDIERLGVVQRRLIVATRGGMVVFDRNTGHATRVANPSDPVAPYLQGVGSVFGTSEGLVCVAAFSGVVSLFNVTEREAGLEATIRLRRNVLGAGWIRGGLVANFFDGATMASVFKCDSGGTSNPGEPVRAPAEITAKRIVDIPAGPFKGVALPVSKYLNRTALAVRPDGERFVLASMLSSRLYIFDGEGRADRIIAGPMDVPLAFSTSRDAHGSLFFALNPETRPLYVSLCATNRFLLALYSGRSFGAYGIRFVGGTELHVFSWEGRLISRLSVTDELYQLAVDSEGDRLYGIRLGPFPSIVEYNLTGLMRETQR